MFTIMKHLRKVLWRPADPSTAPLSAFDVDVLESSSSASDAASRLAQIRNIPFDAAMLLVETWLARYAAEPRAIMTQISPQRPDATRARVANAQTHATPLPHPALADTVFERLAVETPKEQANQPAGR